MATSRATRAGRALFSALIRATRPSCTYDRYRVETSSDRIRFSGSWNKLAVVAKEGDLRTKLGPRPHPGTVALRHRAVVALEQSVAEGRSRAGEPPSAFCLPCAEGYPAATRSGRSFAQRVTLLLNRPSTPSIRSRFGN